MNTGSANDAAATDCGDRHITPLAWSWVRGDDGQVRAFCPLCDRFMGFVRDAEGEEKKQ